MPSRVFAMCGQDQRAAVKRAAGVEPLTCPPVTVGEFEKRWLCPKDPYDLLYFSLHGLPAQPYWYGDDWITALSTETFAGLDLSETVVFVANCYFEGSPMESALLDCNPKALIGGIGQNWTRGVQLVGANLLGWYFRRLICGGIDPPQALHLAKLGVRGRNAEIKHKRIKRMKDVEDIEANLDALEFTLKVKGDG
jgi:hypothetical protein